MSEVKNSVPMTVRVDPTTPDRLAQIALILGLPIGKVVDGMVARNLRNLKENGKMAAYMESLEEREVDHT